MCENFNQILSLSKEIKPLFHWLFFSYSSTLNANDREGVTPLMLAAKKESAFMTKFLVCKGANRDKLDSSDNSVFHYAAMGNREIIEVRMSDYFTHIAFWPSTKHEFTLEN